MLGEAPDTSPVLVTDASLKAEPKAPEPTKDQEQDAEGTNDAKSNRDTSGSESADESRTDDAIKAEREALMAERAAFERERQEFNSRISSLSEDIAKAEKSAEQWERYAREWKEEGRDDLVGPALERAKKIRSEAGQAGERIRQAQLQQQQSAVLAKVVQEFPDLRNKDSELYKGVDKLFQTRPVLATYPDGIRDAVEFVAAKQASAKVAALQKELAETKQRLASREKLLQPATGGPSASVGDGSTFDTLPPDKRRERLMAELRGAEERGVRVL